jgi:hypothetical protein
LKKAQPLRREVDALRWENSRGERWEKISLTRRRHPYPAIGGFLRSPVLS